MTEPKRPRGRPTGTYRPALMRQVPRTYDWRLTMTNQEKIDAIDNHFANWGDATDTMEGFIAWCWDVREETLRSLDRTGGIEQLADDIEYSVQQEDQYRGVEFEQAAVEWVSENTDDLIGALKGSMAN